MRHCFVDADARDQDGVFLRHKVTCATDYITEDLSDLNLLAEKLLWYFLVDVDLESYETLLDDFTAGVE